MTKSKIVKPPPPRTKERSGTTAANRRRIFVNEFLQNGGNGTKAAIAAGFSQKTAKVRSCILLQRPEIMGEIQARQDVLAKKSQLTTERLLLELARIVYADPRKFFNANGTVKQVQELDDDCAAAISSIEVNEINGAEGVVLGYTKKIKLWDKNAAIQKAMQHLGMLIERKEIRIGPMDHMTPDERFAAARLVESAIAKAKASVAMEEQGKLLS